MKDKKIACEKTKISISEMVLPNHTNNLNTLFGGKLMYWMDMAAAICAHQNTKKIAITASCDNITFKSPIYKGDIVTINAFITRVFKSSMEIYIEVLAQNAKIKKSIISNNAFFTFVTLDDKGKPVKSIEVTPKSDEEKKLYDGALRRRQLRLILAGKMKPEEADELKSIFN
jgi:acyl-CoA hydrolase